MSFTKNFLAVAIAGGLLSTAAQAVDISNPAALPARIASEVDIPSPAGLVFTNTGALNISSQFLYNFSNGEVRYARVECILALIIMVAAFNIVSTLTMVVRDKTREIGILKAMGMRSDSIRRIFLLQGGFIGAVGTGMGLALGLATGFALEHWKLIALDPSVYFIDHLPVRLEWFDVGLIVLLSVGVAVLATLHPARQAANLYPIEAIRSE